MKFEKSNSKISLEYQKWHNEIHKSQKTWTIKLINYDKFDVPDENLLIRECAKRCEVIRLRWYD